MVAYVHIEYSTCQFSEESKGGGIQPPHPRSLRYGKKRGPERVNYLGSMCVLILYWSWAAYTGYVELEQPAYSDEVRSRNPLTLIIRGGGGKWSHATQNFVKSACVCTIITLL